uniref:IST1-like protein n=1 Tax=Fagus sylvatica TaxID=28930 RepID=A0A2N9J592_FAGSY
MLHRSFKPAKCKTALKLASSRIKLLKNKKDAQVKQLKREVAQLLESGQDRTARIRVEHVVREEKTIAAFELIEIYCELIAARLPIIESQKNCPIDLKEAISSVIFASPRCADIPELMDIRKHLTAKYGKEFVSAAIELRPDCGVGRMLVEKLSAKAPDGQAKLKILSAIAEEHNVKWDPNSAEEKDTKSYEDLLNGPTTFEKASEMYVEPHVQAPPNHDYKGPPNVQVPPKHEAKHDVSGNFYEHNARSSPHSQNFDSADVGAKKATTFGTFHAEAGSSGTGSEERESRQSYSGDGNAFSLGRQNWNMEFKDATAAAQAAAESAERASMAARAAAELSSRAKFTGQYSMESQKSSAYGLSHEGSQNYAESKFQGEHLAKGPVDNDFPRRNSRKHYEQVDHTEQDNLAGAANRFHRDGHKNTDNSTWSASVDNNPLVNVSQKADRYSRRNSSEQENSDSVGEVSVKKQSSNNEVEFVNELNDGAKSENIDYVGDVSIRKQSSRASSHYHSSTSSDEHIDILNLNHQMSGNDANRDSLVIDEVNIRSDEGTTSYDNAPVVFDGYGSDDDNYKFDVENEFTGQESSLFFSSPGRKSHVNLFENANAWSPRRNIDESFGESISQSHSFRPSSIEKENVASNRKLWLPTSSVDSDPMESLDTNQGKKFSSVSENKFSYGDVPSPKLTKSGSDSSIEDKDHTPQLPDARKDDELLKESNLESVGELNFGKLTGGLRNKGFRRPPYTRGPSGNASSFKQASGDTSSKIEQSPSVTVRTSFSSDASNEEPHNQKVILKQSKEPNSRAVVSSSDSDNDDLKEELSQQTISSSQEPYNQKAGTKVNKNSSSRVPIKYFGADTSDSEEDRPKQASSGNARPITGFSRRTKGSSPSTSRSSYSKATGISEASLTPDYGAERKASLRSSYASEALTKPSSQTKSSDHLGSAEQQILTSVSTERKGSLRSSYASDAPTKPPSQTKSLDHLGSAEQHWSTEQAASKPMPESRRSLHEESLKSSTRKHSSGSLPEIVPSVSTERKASSRGSYASEAQTKPSSQMKISDHLGSAEQRRSTEQASSKPMPESKKFSHEESLKSSTRKHSSGSLPEVLTSGSTGISGSPSSSAETPSKEKASHVHPKLPDYDDLSARFLSLRQSRQ